MSSSSSICQLAPRRSPQAPEPLVSVVLVSVVAPSPPFRPTPCPPLPPFTRRGSRYPQRPRLPQQPLQALVCRLGMRMSTETVLSMGTVRGASAGPAIVKTPTAGGPPCTPLTLHHSTVPVAEIHRSIAKALHPPPPVPSTTPPRPHPLPRTHHHRPQRRRRRVPRSAVDSRPSLCSSKPPKSRLQPTRSSSV